MSILIKEIMDTGTDMVVASRQEQNFSIADIEKIGVAMAKSKLFGMKTPEEAFALCLIAHAEGLHPATAAMDYDIIQGRPALKSNSLLARFQAAGGSVSWTCYEDDCVTATFSHPKGGTVTITWDEARIKQAELQGRDNHKKYPRQMKRARCISEGVRTVWPGAAKFYVPEEVQDFEPRDITNKVEVSTPAGRKPTVSAPAKPEAAPSKPKGAAPKATPPAKPATAATPKAAPAQPKAAPPPEPEPEPEVIEPEVVEETAEGPELLPEATVKAIANGFVDFGITKEQLEEVMGATSDCWTKETRAWLGARWEELNESQLDAAGFMALK